MSKLQEQIKNLDTIQKVLIVFIGVAIISVIIFLLISKKEKKPQIKTAEESVIKEHNTSVVAKQHISKKDIRKNVLATIREKATKERQLKKRSASRNLDKYKFTSKGTYIDSSSLIFEKNEIIEKEVVKPVVYSKVSKKKYSKQKGKKKKLAVATQEVPVPKRRKREVATSESSSGSSSSYSVKKYAKAVIHRNQKIRSGNNVLVRLVESYRTKGGFKIERNTFITMVGSFSDYRMLLTANSIAIKNQRLSLIVKAYDAHDSREGMDISGSVIQDIKKQTTKDILQEISKDLGVPGSRTISRSARDLATNRTVNLSNGDKLLIEIL